MSTKYDSEIDSMGRSSRRAALLSALGITIVLLSLIYAFYSLRSLQDQRAELLSDIDSLRSETNRSQARLDSLQETLSGARRAVAATRTAITAFHQDQFHSAVMLYNEALSIDPDNAYIQNLRAYAMFKLGRIDDAIEGQRLSLLIDPSYAWGYFDLARFLCAATPPRLAEASEAIDRALRLRPGLRSTMEIDREFNRLCRDVLP